ncbi:hypothetical protein AB0945_21160 [Streptomyces sp. NPDC005474]|uniref:hypothetical protein n=1 Tax=Streptomyces sp. NPDC005474 TaxID=3154878 RepID=UPI0034552C93
MVLQTRIAPFTLRRNDEPVRSETAELIMQQDGNLVVYDEFHNPRWGSDTVGRGWEARFQTDGNLAIYNIHGVAVWGSGTEGHPGSLLMVQDDGNVVIYDGNAAIWATNTWH